MRDDNGRMEGELNALQAVAQAVGRALTRLVPIGGHGKRPADLPPRRFWFVGAGNSGEPGTDVASPDFSRRSMDPAWWYKRNALPELQYSRCQNPNIHTS